MPETAKRIRGRIEAVLGHAASLGYREGDSPARWKGRLEHQFAKPSKVHTVKHLPPCPMATSPRLCRLSRRTPLAMPFGS